MADAASNEQLKSIRNFSIIAHIDHGKSTLADRIIQFCGGLADRELKEQVLDSMDLERERGITIKAQSVTLNYQAQDGNTYQLNFIDTPGHVDFSYEVSRSLYACEGALLVVDATQGVEAQSIANCYTAIEQNLEVLPVINKIDLPQADPDKVAHEIEEIIGLEANDAVRVSAKSGFNIDLLLERLVRDIPSPKGDREKHLQALIIDSWFDNYQGVVSLVRLFDGTLKKGDKIQMKSIGRDWEVTDLGYFTPKQNSTGILRAGEVGFVIAGIKDIQGAPVGDTITHTKTKDVPRLPGFQKVKPQVYAGMFPINFDDYEDFRDALEKLALNDASLDYVPENSDALGFGFRVGFLGTLHMEIVQERLEREYNINLLTTAPTVNYEILMDNGELVTISNPSKLPDMANVSEIREPIVRATILVPQEYVGNVISECINRRGVQLDMQVLGSQMHLVYELPMAEVIMDFFDRLKSISKGYASLDYNFERFDATKLVRLDILINGDRVDALALIIHSDRAYSRGRVLVDKIRELIPRQLFDVVVQATIGGHVVARSVVKALRKNVTAKCYGGDITRKKKLLEKQKAGKKRMKQVGRVEIPQDAFLAVLKANEQEKYFMDFSLLLALTVVITGSIWLFDSLFWRRSRRQRQQVTTEAQGNKKLVGHKDPWPVDYARSFFPVLLIVMALRSFVIEPFYIPSGSMRPTLEVGDFILANKFSYGLRLPVINTKIVDVGEPQRGDIMVFRFPHEPSTSFIKRVIGLPGDHIRYENKQLYVNGKTVPKSMAYFDPAKAIVGELFEEHLGNVDHKIFSNPQIPGPQMQEIVVPDHEYFMMGDNRDHSNDSRYWGFVPKENIVGKAFVVWMHWDGGLPSFSTVRRIN